MTNRIGAPQSHVSILALALLMASTIQHSIAEDAWSPISNLGAPSPRIFYHANSAVWTGREMLVWGGSYGDTLLGDGAAYSPEADTWATIPSEGAPSARANFTTVWTGTEMIVWGGYSFDGGYHENNDGARYNPSTHLWTPISLVNAPTKRQSHSAVWTGTEMIVWGGYVYDGTYHEQNDGARYNPLSDTWITIQRNGAPTPRAEHASVWTGTEMIVWGGLENNGGGTFFNDGARYNPVSDAWSPIQNNGSPSPRGDSISAVWTGTEMIICGGEPYDPTFSGGRYNPKTDRWTSISSTGAPTGRVYNTAIWTGAEMIIWGGQNGLTTLNDGARYSPISDTWTTLSIFNAPAPRQAHEAVWTGNQMIIWGGSNNSYLGTSDGNLNDGVAYRIALTPIQGIAELIQTIEGLNLAPGIENSLLSKLENAKALLESRKSINVEPVSGLLDAFINEVDAQSGKAITQNEATALTVEAVSVQSSIGER